MGSDKPKIIIVDELDNIIGYKYREEIKKSDIYRVSALWIKNLKGDFLLAQRGINKNHNPGQWGPAVAGTNDEGDTYVSNILKEANEEIGLKNFDYKIAGKIRRTGRVEGYNFFCQWFVAVIDKRTEDFTLQVEEVQKLQWFNKKELLSKIESKSKNFFSSMEYCLNNL